MLSRTAASLLVGVCFALWVTTAAVARPQASALDAALRAGGFYAGPSHPAASMRNRLGRRSLRRGEHGFDVAELQLALAWQGYPSGPIDGRFGPRLAFALARFQRTAGLSVDGVAGPPTIAALRHAPPAAPIPLGWPLLAPRGDGFGPRDHRFHAALDLLAPARTAVIAAAPGVVTWAGSRDGWGKLVTIAHGHGVRTMYAHLSRIDVKVGQWVAGGTVIGRVGATGDATGPHLHFEVRVDGAAIDPLRALVRLPTDV
jgi:murein DD-endopeptidase MepM/ murein hydrolase activator NlpD